MKKVVLILTVMVFGFVGSVNADVWVNGYTKKNGTYVQGHYRSNPDQYKWNNKSYKDNNSYNYNTYQNYEQPKERKRNFDSGSKNYESYNYQKKYDYNPNKYKK